VTLVTEQGLSLSFTKVVIATGHCWTEEDEPEAGYYSSPWPIAKLLPEEGSYHDFTIGTLGASLSAFDVAASLFRRHGEFLEDESSGRITYRPFPGAEDFRMVMHSSEGVLPHLQFDQVEPLREIYRHVDRETLLSLRDAKGFLRLDRYFDKVCRPVLIRAFSEDGRQDITALLQDPVFRLRDFVEKMIAEHAYADPFEGMRREMAPAEESVEGHRPIHWKEVLDDLMYTLNFHAELMPAEDHLQLRGGVMPFVMNVVAAMPLPSGNTILALHDAGVLSLVPGKVEITAKRSLTGKTEIHVDDEGRKTDLEYRMFIDCSGQKPVELEDFAFRSLVERGTVRKARARFHDDSGADAVPERKRPDVFQENGATVFPIGGIDVDAAYRVIGADGKPNPRIHDIAFTHTSGVRPYSYGLQACDEAAEIVVREWGT
jgi:hypothetical protein